MPAQRAGFYFDNFYIFTNILDFLIIALAVFIIVKMTNRAKRKFESVFLKEKMKEEKAAPLTKDQELLTEIRDLLKK